MRLQAVIEVFSFCETLSAVIFCAAMAKTEALPFRMIVAKLTVIHI